MPELNARSSAGSASSGPHELVYLISRLVVDGEEYAAHHVENRGRCSTCREVWPCDGAIRAQAVIGLKRRRSG